jgi:hypothetical protein
MVFIATRYVTRHKARQVMVIEAEAKSIDVNFLQTRFRMVLTFAAY